MASIYKRKDRQGRPAKKFTALYFDAVNERWRTKSAFTDREASLAMAKRLERMSEREAEGLIDPVLEQAKRPITEHLVAFLDTEVDPCRAPRYVAQIRSRLERVISGVGAERLNDLTTIHVSRFLNDLRIKGRPLSPATRSDYVATCKRLTSWALANGLISRDPLATLKSPGRPRAGLVHHRRALTDEEMARLIAAARRRPLLELRTIRTGPDRGKPIGRLRPETRTKACALGRERAMVYLTARWSGLRRSELKHLLVGDVVLDATNPHLSLRAVDTKSKRADSVALHPQLTEALRLFLRGRPALGSQVFSAIPTMKVFRADLASAGIEYETADGFADFHSLRVSAATAYARAGMSQRSRQAAMRHTDARLTDSVYTDARLLPVAEELSRVPAIPVIQTRRGLSEVS